MTKVFSLILSLIFIPSGFLHAAGNDFRANAEQQAPSDVPSVAASSENCELLNPFKREIYPSHLKFRRRSLAQAYEIV